MDPFWPTMGSGLRRNDELATPLLATERRIADRRPLLVPGDEVGRSDPRPQRLALGRQGLDRIAVEAEPYILAEGGPEPVRQCLGTPLHERQYCLAPEGAVRLGIIGEGVVAGYAEQH